jgi:hypothetical protein
MMTATEKKRRLIEYAQSLYLLADENGKRLHTLQKISDEIRKKYKKTINQSTIGKWAKDNQWEALFQAGRNLAVSVANDKKSETEQEIKEAISSDIAERRRAEMQKKKIADALILMKLKDDYDRYRNGESVIIDVRALTQLSASAEMNIQKLDGMDNIHNQTNIQINIGREFDGI